MKGLPEDRAVQFARYIIEAGATVRETAKEFHISKSTVHKDIQERLPLLNYPLYREVRVVLNRNKEERHLRGGEATRRKYAARRARDEKVKARRLCPKWAGRRAFCFSGLEGHLQAAGRGRSPFRLRRNTRAKPVSPACGGRGCAPSPRSAETLPYIQYSSHIFLPAARQNTFGNRLFTPPQSETQCPPQRKSPGTQ